MQFYLIAPLLFIHFRRLATRVLVITSVTLTLIWMMNSDMTGNGGIYYSTFLYLPVFAAGGLAAALPAQRTPSHFPRLAVRIGLLGLLVLVFAWRPFPPYGLSSYLAPFVLPIVAFLLLWGLKNSPDTSGARLHTALGSHVLRWIASLSYSLYLTHLTVLYSLGSFLLIFGLQATVLLRTVLYLPILVFMAWLLHKLIELPSLRLGQTDLLQTQVMTRFVSVTLFLVPISLGAIFVTIS